MRPTELGWKGLALLVALEIAFFATSYSNLFFLVIAFSCVLAGLGLLGGMRNLRAVTATVGAVPLAAAGRERPLDVVLRSRRRTFDVQMSVFVAGRNCELGYVPMADSAVDVEASLPPLPRGRHEFSSLLLTSAFPFGLLQVRRRIALHGVVLTYPAPLPDGNEQHRRGEQQQQQSGAIRSSVAAGLRPHRRGDELRDVHWKATARRGEPVVREWENESGEEIDLVIDRRCEAEVLEVALSAATAIVLRAQASEQPLTLHSQGTKLRATRAAGERDAVLRWLASAQPVTEGAPTKGRVRHRSIQLPATFLREVARA